MRHNMCIAWYIIYLYKYLHTRHVVIHVLLVKPLRQGGALSLSQVPWPPECPHPWLQHWASRHPLQPTNDTTKMPCCNYAADAWQCDNPSPSVSYAAMCLGLPSSCLLTKEKPDCLTLVHTVRPSDAHRAYLHESDICRTLTISGKRTIIVRLYVWFIPVTKWRPLSRLAMGIKVLWVTSPVQNSQPRSWSQFKSSFPSVWLEAKKETSVCKVYF